MGTSSTAPEAKSHSAPRNAPISYPARKSSFIPSQRENHHFEVIGSHISSQESIKYPASLQSRSAGIFHAVHPHKGSDERIQSSWCLSLKYEKKTKPALKPNLAFDIKFQKVNGIKRQVWMNHYIKCSHRDLFLRNFSEFSMIENQDDFKGHSCNQDSTCIFGGPVRYPWSDMLL